MALLPLLVLPVLGGCGEGPPNCPYAGDGDDAPSAGCFAVRDGGLLLVQGMNGKVSLPGGLSLPGESAQCTAHRETWEETGLALEPRRLMHVFSTGFHLYRCDGAGVSGEIDPPPRWEVRDAFFLAPSSFENYEWRFNDQMELLRFMMTAPGAGL